MIGDDPADASAAQECGVRFYPILVNWEEESWETLFAEGLEVFRRGAYDAYQEEKIQAFFENLGE